MQASEIFDYAVQPKEHVAHCNLCGGSRFSLLSRADRYGLPVWTQLCMGCGLGFIAPRMTASAYANFYATGAYRKILEALFGSKHGPDGPYQDWYRASLIELLAPHLSNSPRGLILDVGGARGGVSQAVRKAFHFLDSKSIDPSGEGDVTCNFEDYDAPECSADLILICQTVDHLLDPMASLKKARKLLSDTGLLYVDAVDFYWVACKNKSLRSALKVDHAFYFTDITMAAMLGHAGFEILQRDYTIPRHVGFICKKGAYQGMIGPNYAAKLLDSIRTIKDRA